MIAWLLRLWRFGDCSLCYRHGVCPKTGPWYARHRVSAACPECEVKLAAPWEGSP